MDNKLQVLKLKDCWSKINKMLDQHNIPFGIIEPFREFVDENLTYIKKDEMNRKDSLLLAAHEVLKEYEGCCCFDEDHLLVDSRMCLINDIAMELEIE